MDPLCGLAVATLAVMPVLIACSNPPPEPSLGDAFPEVPVTDTSIKDGQDQADFLSGEPWETKDVPPDTFLDVEFIPEAPDAPGDLESPPDPLGDLSPDPADSSPSPEGGEVPITADTTDVPDVANCQTDDECSAVLRGLGLCDVAKCIGGICVKATVGCHAPPDPVCADPTHLAIAVDPGTCNPATGKCGYETVLQPCPDGCADGVCPGLPILMQSEMDPGGSASVTGANFSGACVMPGWYEGIGAQSANYSVVAGFEP